MLHIQLTDLSRRLIQGRTRWYFRRPFVTLCLSVLSDIRTYHDVDHLRALTHLRKMFARLELTQHTTSSQAVRFIRNYQLLGKGRCQWHIKHSHRPSLTKFPNNEKREMCAALWIIFKVIRSVCNKHILNVICEQFCCFCCLMMRWHGKM